MDSGTSVLAYGNLLSWYRESLEGRTTHPDGVGHKESDLSGCHRLSPMFLQLLLQAPWRFFAIKLTAVLGF